eukprot:EG_transcript_547
MYWDFGLNYHSTLARITLQKHLTAKYPNVQSDHVFDMIVTSFDEPCDPRFTQWLNDGVDVIFGQVGHQGCLQKLASSWPNVTFFTLLGWLPSQPNSFNLAPREYQAAYLAGYTAGLVTKSKKICVSAPMRLPSPVMDTTGFCRGVHHADPSVQIHLMETGRLDFPLLEIWIVNQSYAIGCDVVFIQSQSIAPSVQANKLGLKSVGWFSDVRLTVGETVITSAFVDPTPMFIRAAEAVLNGTLATETRRADWWMGYEWGAAVLADPSFQVPTAVSARVQAQVANLSRAFCGRVCTSDGCLCNSSACCVTDSQLNALVAFPDFVIEHGVMRLPGRACRAGQLATWHSAAFRMECSDCPTGTYAYNADEVSECRPCPAATFSSTGATQCTPCPAGTYSAQPRQGQCTPCPSGTVAANPGAVLCNRCPSGLSSSDGTQCGSASLVWLAGLGAGVAALLLLLGAWAWWATRNMRRLRKQFSNDNVAVECAAAIARLDLQAVAWLADIPKPNCIQLSFIRIVRILGEVRKYVPDQLLQTLAAGADEGASEAAGDAEGDATSVKSERSTLGHRVHPVGAANVPGVPGRQNSTSSSDYKYQAQSLAVRRVTYLLVQFRMNQHRSSAGHLESNLRAFLGHLVEVAKANAGTLGNVAYDRAVIHWGTGKRAVAEAPTRALETAAALTGFPGRLSGGAELQLSIVVGCGSTITGVVETATNHFFMVGGGQVPLVEQAVSSGWGSALGVQVLITDAVRACVQYTYLCLPRLLEEDELLWEPVARKKEKGDDEWMYQLQEGEEPAAFSPAVLLAPFSAVRKGNHVSAAALIRDLRARHAAALRPADAAALARLDARLDAHPENSDTSPASS